MNIYIFEAFYNAHERRKQQNDINESEVYIQKTKFVELIISTKSI